MRVTRIGAVNILTADVIPLEDKAAGYRECIKGRAQFEVIRRAWGQGQGATPCSPTAREPRGTCG